MINWSILKFFAIVFLHFSSKFSSLEVPGLHGVYTRIVSLKGSALNLSVCPRRANWIESHRISLFDFRRERVRYRWPIGSSDGTSWPDRLKLLPDVLGTGISTDHSAGPTQPTMEWKG